MEKFAIPGAGAIIRKDIGGAPHILMQERCKADAQKEVGLLEIPAGKIREFENIYDCLRREVLEESGLTVTRIEGEDEAMTAQANGYDVICYEPFATSQNMSGAYSIIVQVFICEAQGQLLESTNESRNIRWMPVDELAKRLETEAQSFFPMHIASLRKYVARFSQG